jgi:hypothetical protein
MTSYQHETASRRVTSRVRSLGNVRPCGPGLALLSLMLLVPLAPLAALEVSVDYRMGSMAFLTNRLETDVTFPGTQFGWGFDVGVTQALAEGFTFASSVERDLVLRNTVYNTLTYQQSFLRIGVGPFFGLFNSTAAVLKPGISTAVQVEFPGVAFVSFRSDSTIGGRLVEVGDYTQERSDISAGFYVRNVIMSGVLQTRTFSQKTAADVETVDSLSIYAFQTDIFRKNAPYKVLLSFGYHQLARSFIHPTETIRQTLNSIVIGTNVDLFLTPYLTALVNLESSVYTFGGDALLGISNPGPGGYLFRASVGVKLNTDRLPAKE